jgi:hypothetical protein
MNEFGRLSGVFFEPAKVFADVSARPRFIVPHEAVINEQLLLYVDALSEIPAVRDPTS